MWRALVPETLVVAVVAAALAPTVVGVVARLVGQHVLIVVAQVDLAVIVRVLFIHGRPA